MELLSVDNCLLNTQVTFWVLSCVCVFVNKVSMYAPVVIGASFYCASSPFQPDGGKLSVLLTFSYVEEKWVIFPALSSMLLLDRSCRWIINNNFMKEVQLAFPSNNFFLTYDCVFLVVTLITSISRKCNGVLQLHPSVGRNSAMSMITAPLSEWTLPHLFIGFLYKQHSFVFLLTLFFTARWRCWGSLTLEAVA